MSTMDDNTATVIVMGMILVTLCFMLWIIRR